MSETRTYSVTGMTCKSCSLNVSDEVSEVAGVESVEVDLESSTVKVTGKDFSDDQIKDAVTEAGYTFVS